MIDVLTEGIKDDGRASNTQEKDLPSNDEQAVQIDEDINISHE